MQKRVMTLTLLAGLAVGIHAPATFAQAPRPHFATEHTRREFSVAKPLFLGNWFAPQAYVDGNLIPQDIKPYLVTWMHLGNHEDMQKLDAAGVYFMISGGHRGDLRNSAHKNVFISREEKINLFETYPHFLGFCYWEPGAGSFAYDNVAEDLELVARYGGYLNIQNRGHGDLIEAMLERNPEFMELLRRHADHVIWTTRQTTTSHPMTGVSDTLGAWLDGLGVHRGFNSQFFMWTESGLTTLFGEETATRSHNWPSVFTYPEALVGIEWLEAAALGATVFEFENGEHMFTSRDGQLMPGFKYVLLPLMRQIIAGNFIPDKARVLAETPAAYRISGLNDPHRGEAMFAHLYGPQYSHDKEWLPYTGRYGRLPLLPSSAKAETLAKFATVFDRATWKSGYDKVRWFNERFVQQGRGTSWFRKVNNRWLVYNPHINQNVNTDFEVPLEANPVRSLSGVFTPHTFAIIKEKPDAVQIHISNYRTDAYADLWATDEDGKRIVDSWYDGPVVGAMVNNRAENAPEEGLRESILRLHGIDREPKIASIDGGEPEYQKPFEHKTDWNAGTGTFTIRVRHNGPVNLTLDTSSGLLGRIADRLTDRDTSLGNLALFATATASSHASLHTIPDNAIDGNDRSSRWEASDSSDPSDPSDKSDKSDQSEWLALDLRSPQIFSRIVLKEYLDRITAYRLEYQKGDEWLELARGTTIGGAKTHDFKPVTAQKIRLRIFATKPDSFGVSAAPALDEFAVYGEGSPLTAPYAVETGDFYEAEEDATLAGDAQVVTGNYRNFGPGFVRLGAGEGGVRFLVNAPEPGSYRIGLRYARQEWFGTGVPTPGERLKQLGRFSGRETAVRSLGAGLLNLYVNGEKQPVQMLTPTGSWEYWWVLPEVVELKNGINLVEYRNEYGDAGVCHIDHLQVTRVANGEKTLPSVVTPAVPLATNLTKGTRYDGAGATLTGGATMQRASIGYSGEGSAQIGGRGQAVEFKVDVPEAGYYTVALRYGFPPGWVMEDRSLSGWINGGKVYRYELPRLAEPVKGEPNWQARPNGRWYFNVQTGLLNKGENLIRFAPDEGDTGEVLVDALVIAEPEADFIPPGAIRMETQALTVPINGSEPVKAVIEPADASITSLIWTSADPDIAVALPDGRVRGVKSGKTTITARPAGGGAVSASCAVTVLPVANIAPEAKVTAIGQVGGWRANNVIDGDLKSQWLAHGEVKPGMENPLWIKLEWPESHNVHRIVIHTGGNSGEIEFSDGTKINLIERGMGPKDKKELVLDPPKQTTSVTYRLLDAIHPHAKSVSQIEVDERVE